MSAETATQEAHRIMTICNACRYCEGFCAVYPAMELRRTFTPADLIYLSNLCHNCRDCYYACQYAPPHEFNLNVPRSLAELRLASYRKAIWPAPFAALLTRNGRTVSAVAVILVVAAVLLGLAIGQPNAFFGAHTGANAFYNIISYPAMVGIFSVLALAAALGLGMAMNRLWRAMAGSGFLNLKAQRQAVLDVLRLKYLDGGGYGCNYPDDRFSMARRNFHHAVFYGFLACLASTTIAAFYDHFLHCPAPYPVLSWPVMLGTAGGLSLLVGTAGLIYLKIRMDRAPASEKTAGMDLAFVVLLMLTSLSGLILLMVRSTAAMGSLLAIHLGLVATLFVTMPYGKFLHAVFRYLALVKNAGE